jgi:DNA-binding HxlR family transcriptional regulator
MLLSQCPVSATLRVIGGKWKPLILNELKDRKLRFGQLQRRIPEASHKVLTEQLRQLEQSGILARTIYPETVLRSEYELTPYGESLRPILHALCDWGIRHRRQRRAA